MISLFLDTCNHEIIIGLLNDTSLLDSYVFVNDNNLSEKLLPSIKELIDKNNVNKKDIKRIYIAVGPGSFTGIRIGVAVAKTIAWALKIDIIPISSLEVIASTTTFTNYICPIIDARRGYVYAGIYDSNLNLVMNDEYISLEKLKSETEKYDIEYVSYDNLFTSIYPKANIEKIVKKHLSDETINPHLVNPVYLKRTEAEEKHDNRD